MNAALINHARDLDNTPLQQVGDEAGIPDVTENPGLFIVLDSVDDAGGNAGITMLFFKLKFFTALQLLSQLCILLGGNGGRIGIHVVVTADIVFFHELRSSSKIRQRYREMTSTGIEVTERLEHLILQGIPAVGS